MLCTYLYHGTRMRSKVQQDKIIVSQVAAPPASESALGRPHLPPILPLFQVFSRSIQALDAGGGTATAGPVPPVLRVMSCALPPVLRALPGQALAGGIGTLDDNNMHSSSPHLQNAALVQSRRAGQQTQKLSK